MDAKGRSAQTTTDSAVRATSLSSAPSEREAVVTRVVDAPRALVFDVWTDPRHVAHWWHPKGFESVVCEEMDVRVGGAFRFRMLFANGTVYMSRNIYREIVKPERLVYDETCDENGKPFHKARMTVTFDEHEGKTKITIRARFEWVEGRDPQWTPEMMKQGLAKGWNDNLDRLEPYLDALKESSDQRTRPGN